MTNLPTLDDMLVALDAKGLETDEAWQSVSNIIREQTQRERNALDAAKLALQDGARFREKIMATVAMAKNEATELANASPQAIAGA